MFVVDPFLRNETMGEIYLVISTVYRLIPCWKNVRLPWYHKAKHAPVDHPVDRKHSGHGEPFFC